MHIIYRKENICLLKIFTFVKLALILKRCKTKYFNSQHSPCCSKKTKIIWKNQMNESINRLEFKMEWKLFFFLKRELTRKDTMNLWTSKKWICQTDLIYRQWLTDIFRNSILRVKYTIYIINNMSPLQINCWNYYTIAIFHLSNGESFDRWNYYYWTNSPFANSFGD